MIDTSTTIGNIKLNTPIMNASGILSFPPKLLKRISMIDGIGAVVTKGIGPKKRMGWERNPILIRASNEVFLNAVGYSDPGYKAIIEELVGILPFPKPLICSIYSPTIEGFVETAGNLEKYCDAIEIVVSCPHCEDNSGIGVPYERDSVLLEKTLIEINTCLKKPFFVKVSPVYDTRHLARIIADSGAAGICVTNTLGPGMKIDIYAKKPILFAQRGGLSGAGVKSIAVWAVYQIYEELGKKMPIIGIGGIESHEDIVEYFMAGANAVQVGTSLFLHRENFEGYINSLHSNLKDWLERENYCSLGELRGIAHE
jgi:dihydroorotate dehydrogenase (NAD+) catalytic subunit